MSSALKGQYLLLSTLAVFISLTRCNETRTDSERQRILSENTRGFHQALFRVNKTHTRNYFPVDWTKYSDSKLECGKTYFVPSEGFIKFVLDSKSQSCYHGFLGSKEQHCTVGMLCQGILQFETSEGCTEEFLIMTDGSEGHFEGCGSLTFADNPRIPRNGGTDLHINYKGESPSTPCTVFCVEDLSSSAHASSGIQSAKKLPTSNYYSEPEYANCKCGRTKESKTRIVGGEPAKKFEFPWLGFLSFNAQPKYLRNVFCAAVLISDTHAISAAHCFVKDRIAPDEIDFVLHAHIVDKRIGTESRADLDNIPGWGLPKMTDQDEGSIRVKLTEIINHPLFQANADFDFDIAILKFQNKLNLEDNRISPICLPILNETITILKNANLIVAGWGRPWKEAPSGSRILQKLTLPFIPHRVCEESDETKRTHRHLCAGYLDGNKDSCTGDSGGPLIKKITPGKNQYFLAGVVSAGRGCARQNQFGLYSNVQELLSWITFHVASDSAKWCRR